MTTIFDEKGRVIPVTVIEAGPMTVTQVKTPDKEGYCALQLGFQEKKLQRANRPEVGHVRKAGTSPKKMLREVRIPAEQASEFTPGHEIKLADLGFAPGDYVDISGVSIGKGFAGVMKRHNFAGFRETHGTHECRRHAGSIGTTATPGRVLRGKKMAGQMGNDKVTVLNLQVVEVRPEENLILIRGAAPGAKGGVVMVRFAKKKARKTAAA